MNISISNAGDIAIAKVSGPITETDGDTLKQKFEELVSSQATKIKMDLTLVPIITSTGIGKIIVLFRRLKSQGRELIISGIHENLYSMFTSINLDKMLSIEKNNS